MKKISICVTSFIAVVLVVGCKEELIEDATFRLWCGEELCSWRLEQGKIREAPTWHEGDKGVEFVETPTVISQALKASPRCLVVTTIADVAPSAQVTVGVDFTGDGVVDYEQPVAAVGFREVQTYVTAPRTTAFPRVFISKKGPGRAVLAQLLITSRNECAGPPVQLHDRTLGDACSIGVANECKSGVCCEGICAECCVEPKYLSVDESRTVTPAPVVACAGGAACKRRDVQQDSAGLVFAVVPLQCDPGSRTRPAGVVCLADDDCASGACEGAGATAAMPALPFGADGGGPYDPNASARPCATDFPDAGGEQCKLTQVREGRCL